jgi:hypothetical protein
MFTVSPLGTATTLLFATSKVPLSIVITEEAVAVYSTSKAVPPPLQTGVAVVIIGAVFMVAVTATPADLHAGSAVSTQAT